MIPYFGYYSIVDEVEYEPILRDVFDWVGNKGVFDLITNPPWGEDITAEVLNLEYFGNHSGAKFCSPVVKHLLGDAEILSDDARTKLASIITAKFKTNWERLWETNVVAYSPIKNYDISETTTRDLTVNNIEVTDSDKSKNVTDTRTPNTVDSTSHGKTDTETDYAFGYNSAATDRNPSDRVETSEGGTTVVSKTGTDTDVLSQTDKDDTTVTKTDRDTGTITVTRSGNIGSATNQRLVTEERQLWMWNYFDTIFKDVDNVLALMIYDPCRV